MRARGLIFGTIWKPHWRKSIPGMAKKIHASALFETLRKFCGFEPASIARIPLRERFPN